jgi:hypothetical protein
MASSTGLERAISFHTVDEARELLVNGAHHDRAIKERGPAPQLARPRQYRREDQRSRLLIPYCRPEASG